MSVIHAPGRPKLDLRLLAFPIVMLILLTILFFRFWYFQVSLAADLTDMASATRTDTLSKPAPRGMIYDRNGELLAGLKPEIVVSLVYSLAAKNPGELDRLADVLGTTTKKLKPKIDNAHRSPGLPTPIMLGVTPEVATQLAESRSEFPGVTVDLEPTRFYPDGTDFPHVLGTVKLPSKKDVERIKSLGLKPAPFVGKSGLERSYEAELMGTPGDEVMDIDAKRRPIRIEKRDNPVAGHDLVLSLDTRLQHLATQSLAAHGYSGAVVAVDPKTGEVLCMVSSPTYDQNQFQDGITTEDFHRLLNDPGKPLHSRATDSSFSPGSTFKIVTSLAAFEAGKFDPNSEVFCDGAYHLGHSKVKCLGHHGYISFHTALVKSCNTYFADLGYRTGDKQIRKTCAEVGLGEPTKIDIGGEDLGLVPTDEWMLKNYKHRWYGGDTLNFSIGQGALKTTPLQMCDIAAMVANEGTIYRPHLVRAIKDYSTSTEPKIVQPEVLHQVSATPYFWQTLKSALLGVIEVGTAKSAKIANVEWGGKTGSTEHGHRVVNGKEPKTHSWFVGFAPMDNPKIAICVFVEDAGHGGEVSAPIAKEIVQTYLKNLKPKVQVKKGDAAVSEPASASASSDEQ